MLYYSEYSNGRRYVHAYDEEKHGAPRIMGKIFPDPCYYARRRGSYPGAALRQRYAGRRFHPVEHGTR